MLDIQIIASGSTGNLYRISDAKSVLMLECGLPIKQIRQAFDFRLSEVDACLVTHAHFDHSKSVKEIMAAGIDCYMSSGTAEKLSLSGHRLKIKKALETFTIGTFKIKPFLVKHDCAEPFGYLIQSGGEKLVFLTDSYYCPYRFKGIGYWMIEANYDREILEKNIRSGDVSPAMEKRLVTSHFEFARVKAFFGEQDLSQTRGIWLIHISRGNGDPDRFEQEIQAVTGLPVYVAMEKGGLA